MNLFSSIISRFTSALRCSGKRRYGYLDHFICHVPSGNEALMMIISPDLYRICVVSLPVTTTKEAIRYAPSYFDVSDERTHFGAYQVGEGRYLMSAFDPEPIRVRLEEAGIDPISVERFILAQEAFGLEVLPISLLNGSVLALNDGIVVRLPSEYVSELPKYHLEESLKKLSSCLFGFRVDMYKGGVVSKKTLTFTAILSFFIFLNLLIQGGYSYHEAEKIVEEQEQIKTEKHLPATQMELEALASSWEKKEVEQIKLRKIIAAFATLTLENNNTVLPTPAPAPLATPAPSPSPVTNSIILIPGSKPSDRNLLLVPGDSNAVLGTVLGEYLTSLTYENGTVNFKISTSSSERAEKIRDITAKTLKTNTITIKDKSVEGSIQ
jgi:hypothetical protein